MITDIEDGKIGVLLCKDLSRLGRNNALVAFYTELFLPDHDVRLICINDAIDTGVGENEIMAFKSVINEYYARDISKKIRSSRRVQAQKGEFYGSFAPYGYVRSPQDKHKLIIDEEAAAVVKQIFQRKADGLGDNQIATELYHQNILVPTAYKFLKYGVKSGSYDEKYPQDWHATTIRKILENRVYVGDMVGHKTSSKSFKSSKIVRVPESDWITVEQTHEGIVSVELYERVQEIRKVKKRQNKTHGTNIFAGLLVCADCKHHLGFHTYSHTKGKDGRFICNNYSHSIRHATDHARCSMHGISYKALYEMTLEHLNGIIAANLTTDEILKRINSMNKNDTAIKKRLEKLKKRDRELQMIIQKMIEQNALGEITKATFANMYGKYNAEQEAVTEEIGQIESELSRSAQNKDKAERFAGIIRKYTVCEELNREMMLDMIEKIVVHEATGDYRKRTREQVVEFHYRFVGQIAP